MLKLRKLVSYLHNNLNTSSDAHAYKSIPKNSVDILSLLPQNAFISQLTSDTETTHELQIK